MKLHIWHCALSATPHVMETMPIVHLPFSLAYLALSLCTKGIDTPVFNKETEPEIKLHIWHYALSATPHVMETMPIVHLPFSLAYLALSLCTKGIDTPVFNKETEPDIKLHIWHYALSATPHVMETMPNMHETISHKLLHIWYCLHARMALAHRSSIKRRSRE